jgi:signal transduction histidine kinase
MTPENNRHDASSAQHRALVLETANRVALDILASRTGVEALRHIADAARVLANARYAALGVAHTDRGGLKEFITVGLTPEEEARIGNRPRGLGVLGLLLKCTDALRVDVLAEHPSSVGFPPNHPPMDSFLGVPIRRGETALGSLYLTNKQGGGAFSEADEVAVQALAAHAAVAIYNMQMLSQQRALVSRLITAQEEERRAVAYELHDGLTQYVMAAHAHLESFQRAHAISNQERAAREMEQGLKYLKEAVIESRRLVNGLRLLALDDLGLAGAVEQLVHEEKTRARWEQAEFEHNIPDRRFDKVLETGIYRIVQESLTNARRHAAASQVKVQLHLSENDGYEFLWLEVRDWGRGFNPEDRLGDSSHVGLHGIAERTHLLNGRYELRSAPGQGTLLQATFPALNPQPETPFEEGDTGPTIEAAGGIGNAESV